MAGVKVTDLTSTSTAAIDDIMYIVDTSSNTSKQIEVQNIYSGMPQFETGNNFATVSATSGNVNVGIIGGVSYYSRINNIVHFALQLRVQFIAEISCTVQLDNLAIPSGLTTLDVNANLTLHEVPSTGGQLVKCHTYGTGGYIYIDLECTNNNSDVYDFNVIGMYQVI